MAIKNRSAFCYIGPHEESDPECFSSVQDLEDPDADVDE